MWIINIKKRREFHVTNFRRILHVVQIGGKNYSKWRNV